MNLPIITTSMAVVSVLSFIVMKQYFPDIVTNKPVIAEKITSSVHQSLIAYVDPITGELTSIPPDLGIEPPIAPSVTISTDNAFSSTIHEDGSVSIDTSQIRNPILEADLEQNIFAVTVGDNGMISIDTSHIRTPLVATEINGKVHIEHKHVETSKEIK